MARYIDATKCAEILSEKLGIRLFDLVDVFAEIPTADVVPKSEFEKLVQDGTRLGQENETLKDNNEHLAVMLEEAKSEVERLQAEKDALVKNYAECMKDYASEIFAEIDQLITNYFADIISGVTLIVKIAELKKKYTEGYDGRV